MVLRKEDTVAVLCVAEGSTRFATGNSLKARLPTNTFAEFAKVAIKPCGILGKISFVYEWLNDVCVLECAYDTQDIELSRVIGGKSWLAAPSLCLCYTDLKFWMSSVMPYDGTRWTPNRLVLRTQLHLVC